MEAKTLQSWLKDREAPVFPTKPPSVEYRLTSLGETILEPLAMLMQWAERSQAAIRNSRLAYDEKNPKGLRDTG